MLSLLLLQQILLLVQIELKIAFPYFTPLQLLISIVKLSDANAAHCQGFDKYHFKE